MDEFLNEGPLPVFDNPKEGLAFLDKVEEAKRQELHEEAQRQMAEAQDDPRMQNYFMRTDRQTVVKDDKEYRLCMSKKIPMKVIPYGHALQLLKVEDARKNQRLKAKRKKKAARAARKKSR